MLIFFFFWAYVVMRYQHHWLRTCVCLCEDDLSALQNLIFQAGACRFPLHLITSSPRHVSLLRQLSFESVGSVHLLVWSQFASDAARGMHAGLAA